MRTSPSGDCTWTWGASGFSAASATLPRAGRAMRSETAMHRVMFVLPWLRVMLPAIAAGSGLNIQLCNYGNAPARSVDFSAMIVYNGNAFSRLVYELHFWLRLPANGN